MSSTFEKVQEIIVDELCVDADIVTREARLLVELGADSLDAVELVMRAECEFEIEVDDPETEELVTVGDVVDLIERKLRKKAS